MTNAEVLDVVRQTFMLALRIALPFLLVSMLIGLVLAILQAATSINEQTLMFVLKLVGIVVMIFILGSSVLATMQGFFTDILGMIQAG
ncbi:MAG: flagellar biosynthetic protein FliQ [Bilifractor sp.]|jgi:flagellar biosynthetic protein FliQ|nr:flagellar biosynthetic protein FliQ [Lachnospiraceae bacterium]